MNEAPTGIHCRFKACFEARAPSGGVPEGKFVSSVVSTTFSLTESNEFINENDISDIGYPRVHSSVGETTPHTQSSISVGTRKVTLGRHFVPHENFDHHPISTAWEVQASFLRTTMTHRLSRSLLEIFKIGFLAFEHVRDRVDVTAVAVRRKTHAENKHLRLDF